MFDLFVEFVISFEIITFTLRIYVSLVPFDFIIGFYCVIWHDLYYTASKTTNVLMKGLPTGPL